MYGNSGKDLGDTLTGGDPTNTTLGGQSGSGNDKMSALKAYGYAYLNYLLGVACFAEVILTLGEAGEMAIEEGEEDLEAGTMDLEEAEASVKAAIDSAANSTEAEAETRTTQQMLQDMANQADQNVPGSGTISGTLKHTNLASQVTALDDPYLASEVSYKDGQIVKYGTPGGVRLDVVEYNTDGSIKAIYDLKTGKAGLTQSRITQIQDAVHADVPVIEIRPNK